MRSALLTVLLLLSQASWSQVAGREALAPADAALFNQLLLEFPLEVKTFDQTRESADVVEKFAKDWAAFAVAGKALPKAWFDGYSWSPFVRESFQARSRAALGSGDNLERVETSFPAGKAHSIDDPRLYAVQRIGEQITHVLQSRAMNTILYAGSAESAAAGLGVADSHIRYLPSPYEAWGLRKGFISRAAFTDGKARYLMVIPPSRQYLIHYAQLFDSLGLKPELAILNHSDQERQIHRFRQGFQALRGKLPATPDVIALGYYNNIQKALGPTAPLTPEIPLGEGLTVQLVDDHAGKLKYLIVKSDLTIWGESSAFVVEGALELKPKSVLFMGSAGGISAKTNVYDVSIPGRFVLNGQTLPVKNEIYENLKNATTRTPGVILGGTHGHTNSPIEQSKDYVSAKLGAGIDSIDVEQNLIAEAVHRHNKKTGENVRFGAINLITDKPRSWQHEWHHEFDLSQINAERKGQARERSVLSALQGWRLSGLTSSGIRCEVVFQAGH